MTYLVSIKHQKRVHEADRDDTQTLWDSQTSSAGKVTLTQYFTSKGKQEKREATRTYHRRSGLILRRQMTVLGTI